MVALNQSPWDFLVVADDLGFRETLFKAIRRSGGEINSTSDMSSALAYISRRKLDGIVIDMRVEGSLSLVSSIRRGSSNRYTVIFGCCGEDQDAAQLLNSGVNFVVHRTLDGDKISAILDSAVALMVVERQRYSRYRLAVPVILKSPGKEQRALTANISRGGMAVRCRESLEPGSAINFILDLPDGAPVQGQGEIAWAKIDGNMGIKFHLLGDHIKEKIWSWIERHAGAQYRPATS
jgi:ActR/RegA family two-component response regulator